MRETTQQLRRKISKLSTSSLLKKYNEGKFEPKETEIAKEFLIKRGELKEPTKPEKVEKIKKVKKDRKIFKAQDGKELTKSMYMRRLIRNRNDIKPKELNELLVEAGFTKAYHSEIKRCRDIYNIVITKN